MKTIKCQVRCQYWNRAEEFEIEVDDDATEEQIEEEMRDAAVELAHFNYWVSEKN